MKVLCITLICSACVFIAVFLLHWLTEWVESDYNAPRLKFKQWKDIYYLNPERWDIGRYTVRTWTGIDWIHVGFSYVDNIRYRFWLERQRKEEAYSRDNEQIRIILEQAQEDIEELKKRADSEMKEAKATVREVSQRIDEIGF